MSALIFTRASPHDPTWLVKNIRFSQIPHYELGSHWVVRRIQNEVLEGQPSKYNSNLRWLNLTIAMGICGKVLGSRLPMSQLLRQSHQSFRPVSTVKLGGDHVEK